MNFECDVPRGSTQGCFHHDLEVDVPNWVACLNHTPVVKRYVVKYGSKNEHQIDMCLKANGQHAHNMITTLGSIVNIMWGTYVTI